MRVAVFGATGVVGSAVVEALRRDPDKRVDAIIGLARSLPPNPQPHVDWRRADLGHDDVAPHLRGVDAVIDVAWERGGGNVERIDRLLAVAAEAGVRHVVRASSFVAYSPVDAGHDPVDEAWPTEGLAKVRLAQEMAGLERLLHGFASEHEIVRLVWIRSGVVLGPGARSQFAARFGALGEHLRAPRRLPLLPGVAHASLPAVHHDDLAAAFRSAVTGSGVGPYNVALDAPLDLAALSSAFGARPVAIPENLLQRGKELAERVLGERSPGEWLDLAAGAPTLDSTRARKELGWEPVHSLDDAVRATLRGS